MAVPLLNILVGSNYFPENLGGIEIVAGNLVKQLRQQGHHVRWVANDEPQRKHLCHRDDVPLRASHYIEYKLGFPLPIPNVHDLSAAVQHVKWCDVLHIHDSLYLSNQFLFRIARRFHKPLITTQHVGLVPYQQTYKMFLQRMAHGSFGRSLLQGSYQVVFVSRPVKTWFERRVTFARPPMLIPNGVDLELFQPCSADDRIALRAQLKIPADSPFLLFVGRFTEKKGLHLIRAVAKQQPKWHWVLIGRESEQKPATWSLPNVEVLPPKSQTELGHYYGAADLLVLPSVGEGFPLVIPEAMACGVPVLVSDETSHAFPNLSEMVLSTQPEVSSLTQAIGRALENRESLEQLRIKAREYAEKVLVWQAIAAEYGQLFEAAVAQRRTTDYCITY